MLHYDGKDSQQRSATNKERDGLAQRESAKTGKRSAGDCRDVGIVLLACEASRQKRNGQSEQSILQLKKLASSQYARRVPSGIYVIWLLWVKRGLSRALGGELLGSRANLILRQSVEGA